MALIYLFAALFIQGSLIYANEETEATTSAEVYNDVDDVNEKIVNDFDDVKTDWVDTVFTPSTLLPSSSEAIMNEAINSDEPDDKKMDNIKEVTDKITMAIKSEMESLLSYALNTPDTDEGENNLRKKRSIETPMDSTQLVLRLLKHIKSNNEFQNIAIDKMMTAQEIADKFGIEFSPDPEILSDLATAANDHANELSAMLNEACKLTNNTRDKFTIFPLNDEESIDNPSENNTFYVYALYYPEDEIYSQSSVPSYEYLPEQTSHSHYHYNYPYQSNLSGQSENHQHIQSVSQKPSFYDAVSYSPEQFSSYRSAEPISPYAQPIETLEPEPELVAEEYEESMCNRVIVERGEEIGSATVNHITTYSISEKSYFKSPNIEKLPQQMQYSFYLI